MDDDRGAHSTGDGLCALESGATLAGSGTVRAGHPSALGAVMRYPDYFRLAATSLSSTATVVTSRMMVLIALIVGSTAFRTIP